MGKNDRMESNDQALVNQAAGQEGQEPSTAGKIESWSTGPATNVIWLTRATPIDRVLPLNYWSLHEGRRLGYHS